MDLGDHGWDSAVASGLWLALTCNWCATGRHATAQSWCWTGGTRLPLAVGYGAQRQAHAGYAQRDLTEGTWSASGWLLLDMGCRIPHRICAWGGSACSAWPIWVASDMGVKYLYIEFYVNLVTPILPGQPAGWAHSPMRAESADGQFGRVP